MSVNSNIAGNQVSAVVGSITTTIPTVASTKISILPRDECFQEAQERRWFLAFSLPSLGLGTLQRSLLRTTTDSTERPTASVDSSSILNSFHEFYRLLRFCSFDPYPTIYPYCQFKWEFGA